MRLGVLVSYFCGFSIGIAELYEAILEPQLLSEQFLGRNFAEGCFHDRR